MPNVPQKIILKPFWQTTDGKLVRLYQGDVVAVLKRLPAKSVHCVVTSPPYWGLRDYGTASWVGGSEDCDHSNGYTRNDVLRSREDSSPIGNSAPAKSYFKKLCGRCGAKRVDNQLGLEQRPDCLGWATGNRCGECFVCHMVAVFTEVHRVLRDDGVCWLNLGSTFLSSPIESDEMVLRDDLTEDELHHVLEELAKCQKSAHNAEE